MTIDVFILGLVLVFALVGAVTGVARQIAQSVALFAAMVAARPVGTFLGPRMAKALQGPQVMGTVAATVLVFLVVLFALRYILTLIIQRILAGRNPEDRGLDRSLGFVLGGGKVLVMAYVMLCALAFAEEHIVVAGKKLGISPKDSIAFSVARNYNLFEYTQFSGVKDLVALAKATREPEHARQLQSDPAYKSLRKDPRFQQALNDAGMQKALQTGDFRALLQNNAVLQLVQDPVMAARLAAAASATQKHLLEGKDDE